MNELSSNVDKIKPVFIIVNGQLYTPPKLIFFLNKFVKYKNKIQTMSGLRIGPEVGQGRLNGTGH